MKKILGIVLAIVLCLSMTALAEADYSGFAIGYNNNSDNDTFSKTLHDGSEAACKELGMEWLYAESNFDPTKIQANNSTLILQGADVLVDFNVTPDAYTNLVEGYREQNIPVIMVDTYFDEPTDGAYFFGANNTVAGNTAGNYFVDYAAENWDGDLDLVISIGTWTQGLAVQQRCDGFIEGVQQKMPEYDVENAYEIIECGGSSGDQMMTVMTQLKNMFVKYPEADHIAIGVYSEHLMQAIFSAVEQENKADNVIVVSLGCEDYFKEDVKQGAHEYWKAAVSFFPERYGEYIVNICKQFADGEEVPTYNYMDHIAVDRESVKEVYPDYFA